MKRGRQNTGINGTRKGPLKALIGKESPLIFDVGANNGSSIHDFKAWWPKSDIHCFEPQQECYQDLVDAAEAYKTLGSVRINSFAVGRHS